MEAASAFAATGTLRYVGPEDLERIRSLDGDPVERAHALADACRINALYAIARAGSGHIGTSFSCIDLLCWLHLEAMGGDDIYFSSKGHDAPALYAVLAATGRIEFELLHRLRRRGGLPGHPDVRAVPAVNTNTGSLGMGISKARGFARAARARGERRRIWVLTGDGELQEGQFWESLGPTAEGGFSEITAIVDHNKIQSDTWVEQVSPLGDLEAKLTAFGWAVGRCDGNDLRAVGAELERLERDAGDRPRILVADTVKGSGVSFFEPHGLPRSGTALYGYHSGAPSPEEHGRALGELEARLAERLGRLGAEPPALVEEPAPERPPAAGAPQRIVAAYGEELAAAAEREPRLWALDADLYLDTGLIPFRAAYPDRFVECGIAEMDMVSQAGAMALSGLVPAVHSFACFLTTRANEQVFNNATEATKVIYAGSLAGIVPGGPGHSHQSVRDIALMGSVPGMRVIEPGSEHVARLAVRWALEEAEGPVYLRLVSVPWELPYEPPAPERLVPGRGEVVREGGDCVIVGYGPVLLSQAWLAADELAVEGIGCAVVDLPWLREVDADWLAAVSPGAPVVALDNHVATGGQGEAIAAALARSGVAIERVAVEGVAEGGTNDEVLAAHGLDAASIAERVRSATSGGS